MFILVGIGILIDRDLKSQQTKWFAACLQEQKADGYNHERAKLRCMMRWIEVEKASQ